MPLPALLLLALSLVSCARENAPARIDPTLVSLLPPDTYTLVGGRIDQLQQAPAYQKYVSSFTTQVDEFVKRTGLDPRKDLGEFLVSSNGKETVLLVKGRFEVAAIEKQLASVGQARDVGGRRVWSTGDQSLCFANSSIAIVARDAQVEGVLKQVGRTVKLDAHLAGPLEKIPSAAPLWGVVTGGIPPFEVSENSNLANLSKVIASVRTLVAWSDFSNGFKLTVTGTCQDEAGAKTLHSGIRGLIGIGRLTTPQDQPELLRVFDALITKQDGAVVEFTADLSMQQLESLQSVTGRLGRR